MTAHLQPYMSEFCWAHPDASCCPDVRRYEGPEYWPDWTYGETLRKSPLGDFLLTGVPQAYTVWRSYAAIVAAQAVFRSLGWPARMITHLTVCDQWNAYWAALRAAGDVETPDLVHLRHQIEDRQRKYASEALR
jgi:hypothetical protein